MNRSLTLGLAAVFIVASTFSAFAAEPNRDAIKKRVDEVVAQINNGKTTDRFPISRQKKIPTPT